MKAETIEKAITDLVSVYGGAVRTPREGSQTLARLAEVELPPGCRPATTPMLLVLDTAAEKPVAFLQPGPRAARRPRHVVTPVSPRATGERLSLQRRPRCRMERQRDDPGDHEGDRRDARDRDLPRPRARRTAATFRRRPQERRAPHPYVQGPRPGAAPRLRRAFPEPRRRHRPDARRIRVQD